MHLSDFNTTRRTKEIKTRTIAFFSICSTNTCSIVRLQHKFTILCTSIQFRRKDPCPHPNAPWDCHSRPIDPSDTTPADGQSYGSPKQVASGTSGSVALLPHRRLRVELAPAGGQLANLAIDVLPSWLVHVSTSPRLGLWLKERFT